MEAGDGLPLTVSQPAGLWQNNAGLRPYQDASRITDDPDYGRMVCFCERVSAGELRDAFASTIPPVDLDGLRRRTRVMNGRCQGFYCAAEVCARAAAASGRPMSEWMGLP